jgi:hypothetical protein
MRLDLDLLFRVIRADGLRHRPAGACTPHRNEEVLAKVPVK